MSDTQFHHTHDGAKPSPTSRVNRESTNPWGNPNVNSVDTKRSAQEYQARIGRLAAEAADVTRSPQSRDIAKREHDALVKALRFQRAGWAEIDARRGAK